ncbi:hypothetical protein BKA70DRAFT_1541526 [Coprinopsis sp. MPI-PUGE-AT-0042]|nr:hypothetical protein BKA70DRAFT_1541526 [Coprinopsis sp. MPI-PUGE-AT-0042]
MLEPTSNYDQDQPNYFIGVSQNNPVDLAPFLQSNLSDSASKNFALGQPEGQTLSILRGLTTDELPLHHPHHQRVLFHSDRIYRHDTFHVNYTTYDLQQEQDTVNTNASRCNIMCLGESGSHNRYVYARVLGIYHVNIAYSGPGSSDMKIRLLRLLMVTALTNRAPTITLEHQSHSFAAPTSPASRSCNATTRCFLSRLAHEEDDWHEYFVNRFVDLGYVDEAPLGSWTSSSSMRSMPTAMAPEEATPTNGGDSPLDKSKVATATTTSASDSEESSDTDSDDPELHLSDEDGSTLGTDSESDSDPDNENEGMGSDMDMGMEDDNQQCSYKPPRVLGIYIGHYCVNPVYTKGQMAHADAISGDGYSSQDSEVTEAGAKGVTFNVTVISKWAVPIAPFSPCHPRFTLQTAYVSRTDDIIGYENMAFEHPHPATDTEGQDTAIVRIPGSANNCCGPFHIHANIANTGPCPLDTGSRQFELVRLQHLLDTLAEGRIASSDFLAGPFPLGHPGGAPVVRDPDPQVRRSCHLIPSHSAEPVLGSLFYHVNQYINRDSLTALRSIGRNHSFILGEPHNSPPNLGKSSTPYSPDVTRPPKITFWTIDEWKKRPQGFAFPHGAIPSLGFLQRADGCYADSSRIALMTKYFKELVGETVYACLEPKTWSKKDPEVGEFVLSHLMDAFKEFTNADDKWKAEFFATAKYPDTLSTRKDFRRPLYDMVKNTTATSE